MGEASKALPSAEWVRDLLRSSSALPYDYYPEVTAEERLEYALRQTMSSVESPSARCAVIDHEDRQGLAVTVPLAWDSDVLGVPAGRVTVFMFSGVDQEATIKVSGELACSVRGQIDELSLQHVSVRLDARELLAAQTLERAGFEIVDGILKFSHPLDGDPLAPTELSGIKIREATEADIPRLRELAEAGFVYDRFHNDPRLSKTTSDRLHGIWTENAVRGKTGAGVLVGEVDGEVGGFFILAEDKLAKDVFGKSVGTLVLITVGKAYRRRGLAKALSRESLRWLQARGNRWGEVGTQLANTPASSVYLAAGFRMAQTSLSLRYWSPGA